MIRNSDKPIFIQLSDVIKDEIIEKKLHTDDRIPSVREMAAEYEINNNTAMRTIEALAKDNIIYQKRGMGYYVSNEALDIIKKERENYFFNDIIPSLRKYIRQLGITGKQLAAMLDNNAI